MQPCLPTQQCKAVQFSYFTKDCQNKLVCRGCDSKTPLIYHLHSQRFWRDFFSSSYCQSSAGYSLLMHLSIKHALFKSCFLSSFSNNQYMWIENWAPGRITSNRAFAQAPCYLDFFGMDCLTLSFPLQNFHSWKAIHPGHSYLSFTIIAGELIAFQPSWNVCRKSSSKRGTPFQFSL